MSEPYTEVTNTSWFQRIGRSIMGVGFGLLLSVGMVALLSWNEGRAVHEAADLSEVRRLVVNVSDEKVDAANDAKLVHLTSEAKTEERLADTEFGITLQALRLKRSVEMYQYEEKKTTETKKKVGGGEQQVTTYSYPMGWFDHPVDSRSFHDEKYVNKNPTNFPFQPWHASAQEVTFGAFRLTPSLVEMIDRFAPVPLASQSSLKTPEGFKRLDDELHKGDSTSSKIGDVRIRWQAVTPTVVSLIAQQTENSFVPYRLSSGRTRQMLSVGRMSAEDMIQHAETMNTLLTWALRAGGLIGMWCGLAMIFAPLGTLADVIPFVGSIVRFGTGVVAFTLASVASLVVIAIAWFAYRPVLAGGLIVAAVAIVVLVRMYGGKRAENSALMTPVPPPPPPPSVR